MKHFAALCADLERTSHESVQQQIRTRYVSIASSVDADVAFALVTGSRSLRMMSSRELADLLINFTNTPLWLFEKCRTLGGTLVDAAALLLPKTKSHCPYSLNEILVTLSSLHALPKELRNAAIIDLLLVCSVQERTTLARMLVGARPARYMHTSEDVAETSSPEQLMVATILYAHKSQDVGSRTFSHFTLGVKLGEIYVPLTKVANTFDEESNRHVEDFASRRTVEKFGPTHWNHL